MPELVENPDAPAAVVNVAAPASPVAPENPAVPSSPASSATSARTPDEVVERCMTAYKRAYNACEAKGEPEFRCKEAGEFAFRVNMPSTGSLAEVQAFIACVTRGIHLDIWRPREPMQFFYAAQIAISAHRRESKK
jgi:hypothetical protein